MFTYQPRHKGTGLDSLSCRTEQNNRSLQILGIPTRVPQILEELLFALPWSRLTVGDAKVRTNFRIGLGFNVNIY